MNVSIGIGGVALSAVFFAAIATGSHAQQSRYDQGGYSERTNWSAVRSASSVRQIDRRARALHASHPSFAAPASLTMPYLVDTNGRRCRGFGRLFPLNGERVRGIASGLREQRVSAEDLRRLGEAMVERSTDDARFDSEMPAGYTFLAQFIDHDITFDATSMLNRPIRDDEFENARTVALDLDSLYGRGPEQDPYLYNLPYLRVGNRIGGCGTNARFDLLRSKRGDASGPRGGSARALIGDPRNDENFIIAQLHGAFIAFHNRFVDLLIDHRLDRQGYRACERRGDCDTRDAAAKLSRSEKKEIFEAAREHVIHYYHRIIMEDFLPRLIGEARLRDILQNGRSFFFPKGFHRNGGASAHPFIPVEFAVAAFRYGHSQVRESYQLRRGVRTTLLDAGQQRGGGSPAFQPVRRRHIVDWRYFFPITRARLRGFNLARRIDPDIAPFLHDLGRSRVVGREEVISLAARNLVRATTFRLPSGQAIAAHMLPSIQDRGLLPHARSYRLQSRRPRTAERSPYILAPDRRTQRFLGHAETPLWYYILQEAAAFGGPSGFGEDRGAIATSSRRRGIRYASLSRRVEPDQYHVPRHESVDGPHGLRGHTLGPVGATLVGEVLTGLIAHYRESEPGKGLSFRPTFHAATKTNRSAPLSLTPMPHVNRGYFGRYLMRNLLTDIGQSRPISLNDPDTCRYFNDDRLKLSRHGTLRQRYPSDAFPRDYGAPNGIGPAARRYRKNSEPKWVKRAFQSD